jgi:hypothetical protein
MKHSPRQVAEWMVKELKKSDYFLYQEQVVHGIADTFGDEFVYTNRNGNLGISRDVLKEFRKLTQDTVVWERGQRVWRKREDYDSPGRKAH